MKRQAKIIALALLTSVIATTYTNAASPRKGTDVKFKKTILDTAFRSEGVAVADVNQDGKLDILAGEVWYEAPNWKMHELRPAGNYDPAKGYSNTFANYAWDMNGDGWTDSITTTMMGQPCRWFENPQNKPGHWKVHEGTKSACNETPLFADLFGNGKPVPLFGVQPGGYIAWFEFTKNPTDEWLMHKIAGPKAPGSEQFSHGLGVGDINGDGRNDVLVIQGWWEAPEDRRQENWKLHPANFGPGCADMLVYDIDEDGDSDVITSSAHNYGLWWYEQMPIPGEHPTFKQHEILAQDFSQGHALKLVDINNDGKKDFVVGKRYFAHNGNDPGANEPAVVYWFEIGKKKNGRWKFSRHVVDEDSGLGTQFEVADLNNDGRMDIIGSNKKGVFVFVQQN